MIFPKRKRAGSKVIIIAILFTSKPTKHNILSENAQVPHTHRERISWLTRRERERERERLSWLNSSHSLTQRESERERES